MEEKRVIILLMLLLLLLLQQEVWIYGNFQRSKVIVSGRERDKKREWKKWNANCPSGVRLITQCDGYAMLFINKRQTGQYYIEKYMLVHCLPLSGDVLVLQLSPSSNERTTTSSLFRALLIIIIYRLVNVSHVQGISNWNINSPLFCIPCWSLLENNKSSTLCICWLKRNMCL